MPLISNVGDRRRTRDMNGLLLVAAGGALGSVARYKLSGYVLHHTVDWRFPVGTFSVNVVGCLVAGLLAGLAEQRDVLSSDARLLLFTGVLGGFTTFSAFGLETMFLLKRGDVLVAAANVALSVAVGLVALWLGMTSGSLKG
jgi:CrcB protein